MVWYDMAGLQPPNLPGCKTGLLKMPGYDVRSMTALQNQFINETDGLYPLRVSLEQWKLSPSLELRVSPKTAAAKE